MKKKKSSKLEGYRGAGRRGPKEFVDCWFSEPVKTP